MIVHSVALVSSFKYSLISVSPEAVNSLDNAIRNDLQKFSHSLYVWVLVSAFIVAIGVALEGPELLHEMWPRLFTCFTLGSVPRLRKFKSVIKKVGFWGWLLVVVGVAGEGIFEMLQNRAEGQLQAFNEILLADAQRMSASAKERAGEADERAADANERAGQAEERAAKLLAGIQPRRLSPDQEKDIANALKPYAGKTVSIATYRQDAEAMILALQIAEALDKAKITVQNRLGTFDAVGLPLFLGVTVDTNSSDKKLECALFDSLKTKGRLVTANTPFLSGVGSTMFVPAQTKPDDAFIFVGEKPIAEETWQSNTKANSNPCTKP